jgi:hypothetical protein
LVVDSVSKARETSRYSVAVLTMVSMMDAPFERLVVEDRTGAMIPPAQSGEI